MENNEKASNFYKQMIIDNGNRIEIHTPYCKKFKETHENCFGCESELGCQKLARILLVQLQSMMTSEKSNDLETVMKNTNYASNIIHKIIKAKTKEEINNIQ